LIGNKNRKKIKFKVTLQEPLHKNSKWLEPYMFNYENIDKIRLLKLFKFETSLEKSLENLKI